MMRRRNEEKDEGKGKAKGESGWTTFGDYCRVDLKTIYLFEGGGVCEFCMGSGGKEEGGGRMRRRRIRRKRNKGSRREVG